MRSSRFSCTKTWRREGESHQEGLLAKYHSSEVPGPREPLDLENVLIDISIAV